MEPEEFLESYESALATQNWESVSPLIHEDICVTFSNGHVYRGKEVVQGAFELLLHYPSILTKMKNALIGSNSRQAYHSKTTVILSMKQAAWPLSQIDTHKVNFLKLRMNVTAINLTATANDNLN